MRGIVVPRRLSFPVSTSVSAKRTASSLPSVSTASAASAPSRSANAHGKFRWCLNLDFSVNLCVLCASVVVISHIPLTTEAQRTQRFTEKQLKLRHHLTAQEFCEFSQVCAVNV